MHGLVHVMPVLGLGKSKKFMEECVTRNWSMFLNGETNQPDREGQKESQAGRGKWGSKKSGGGPTRGRRRREAGVVR